MRIGLVILGCDKNTVDAEHFAGMLARRMPDSVQVLALTDEAPPPPDLAAVVIYTCGFILDARMESIEAIVAWGRCKMDAGNPARLYVAGCLSQRHAAELRVEFPEVDGFFGVHEMAALADRLCASGVQSSAFTDQMDRTPPRQRLDARPYAFLKIADGCNHACTFCVIPAIKGACRSVPRETLLAEARMLLDSGVREINLIAQDTTAYGRDRYKTYRLADLLRDLCALPGEFWVRCLYCYPGGITDALVEQLASQPKIVPYLDMPLQHTSPNVLRAMKRPEADQDIPALVARLRQAIPKLVLRTTMMVAFPGETARDHRHMLAMMERLAFEWLGAFIFSPEDGTPAATMPGQVSRRTAARRHDAVMAAQAEITERFNMNRQGTRTRALIEAYDPDLGLWRGRSAAEAPEVDGCLLIRSGPHLRPGQFVAATLEEASVYDMTATVAQPE